MDLDAVLRAAGPRVERPPLLWEVAVEGDAIRTLVAALVEVGRAGGVSRPQLVLNASNMVMGEDEDERFHASLAAGRYVALSVSGPGRWFPVEGVWVPDDEGTILVTHALTRAARAADVRFAYTRLLAEGSAVVVLLDAVVAESLPDGRS